MSINLQLFWLFTLAIPVACVAWTITHEEVFREPREFCVRCSKQGRSLLTRKFFYLFTCEYCFSHYVAVIFVALTDFRLLIDDWRGYIISGFALVWVANIYMSLFARVRIELKRERTEVSVLEKTQLSSRPKERNEKHNERLQTSEVQTSRYERKEDGSHREGRSRRRYKGPDPRHPADSI